MTTLHDLASTLKGRQQAVGVALQDLAADAGLNRITLRKLFASQDVRLSTLLAAANRLGLDVVLIPQAVSSGMQQAPSSLAPGGGPPVDGRAPQTAVRAALETLRRNLERKA